MDLTKYLSGKSLIVLGGITPLHALHVAEALTNLNTGFGRLREITTMPNQKYFNCVTSGDWMEYHDRDGIALYTTEAQSVDGHSSGYTYGLTTAEIAQVCVREGRTPVFGTSFPLAVEVKKRLGEAAVFVLLQPENTISPVGYQPDYVVIQRTPIETAQEIYRLAGNLVPLHV